MTLVGFINLIYIILYASMGDVILISDSRDNFKAITFSNFKRNDVYKKLQNAIYYNKQEEAFFWTGELLCSNMLLQLWESYFLLMSKYIHIHNPKLPLYILKKYLEFRKIISQNDDIAVVRNNHNMRIIFFSITTILCESQKLTILDDLRHQFVFKIENLYDNLKAPNIEFVKMIYIDSDPKEFLVPFNEFIYHLTDTKSKVDIVYWINWIIEFDILCRKKKNTVSCAPRSIFKNTQTHLERNVIWILWDFILKHSNETLHNSLHAIIQSLFELFSTRYALSINKKRRSILYHAIEIIILHQDIKYNIPILSDNRVFNNLEKNISTIFSQLKDKEKHEMSIESESKIDVYKSLYMSL